MMRFRILRPVLYAPESRHTRIVKRRMIGPKTARHARLEKFQFPQGRQHLVHDFAILVIVVQPERQHSARSRIVHQYGRNFFQIILVRFHVALRTDQTLFFSSE